MNVDVVPVFLPSFISNPCFLAFVRFWRHCCIICSRNCTDSCKSRTKRRSVDKSAWTWAHFELLLLRKGLRSHIGVGSQGDLRVSPLGRSSMCILPLIFICTARLNKRASREATSSPTKVTFPNAGKTASWPATAPTSVAQRTKELRLHQE